MSKPHIICVASVDSWFAEIFGPSFNDLVRQGSSAERARGISRWAIGWKNSDNKTLIYFKDEKDYVLAVTKYGLNTHNV
ncbi:MAG: hypothetical protein N2235_01430 [Fischerella sp.]|nr:hypothetical protein [Fischerella sp.]